MDAAQRFQDPPMIGLRPVARLSKLRHYSVVSRFIRPRIPVCNASGSHGPISRPMPGQLSMRGTQQHRSSTVAHAKKAKAVDAATRTAGTEQQQQQGTSWQQQLSSSMSHISNKQLFHLVVPGRDVPMTMTTLSIGWAAVVLAAAVVAAGASARLLSRDTSDDGHHTHLQSLAAAAAAGSSADGVVSVPGAVVSGALLEVEQHRQQLAGHKQEVDLLQRDAAVAHTQLSAAMQVAEAQLNKAKQTSASLDKELSHISGLLQQQQSALAGLASDAAAAAAAHRESLTVNQRKVRLLDEMLLTLRQKLAEADSNREALLQGAVAVSAAELSSVELARDGLAQQIAELQQQLDNAQSRLSAAECQAADLEGHLSLLTDTKQQMAARLTDLEVNAAAAAAAAKQAVASAEGQLSSITAAAAEGTAATEALAAALQQRQEELDTLQQQLKLAQDELATAAAEARAAAAAAAIIGQSTMQGYPVEGQLSDVTVTVRQTPSAAAAAVTAAVEQQYELQCADTVAGLSAAVLLRAGEVGRLQVELQQQLMKVSSAAAGRSPQLLDLLSRVTSDLAAAQQQAEDERAQLAAVREGMAEVFEGLLVLTGTSSNSKAGSKGIHEKHAAAAAADSVGDVLRKQLQEIKAGVLSHANELEVMMSLARMRLSQEKQALLAQLEEQQDSQQVMELLRTKLHPELLEREQTIRQELQQLQHQQHVLQQQLGPVEAAEAAAQRAAAEKAAVEERARAAAEKAARDKAAAEARAKAEAEARIAREKAAAEQARLQAANEARAREQAAAAAAAVELAAAQDKLLAALEAAEECYQTAQKQQSAIQQQQQQRQKVSHVVDHHVHAQLSQLTVLQAHLQQQGDQLAAYRHSYEEGLTHTAAAAVAAAAEVTQVTQELTRLQSAFTSCHVELAALDAAAEAANMMAKPELETEQAEQQLHAFSRNGNNGSSSSKNGSSRGSNSSNGGTNRGTIVWPGVDASNGAVLYVGDAASGLRQQQRATKSRNTGSRNAATTSAAASAAITETSVPSSATTGDADDVLALAQKLLEGDGSSSSSSSVASSATSVSRQVASAAAAVTTTLLPPKQQVLRLKSAGYLLPHPAKRDQGGEDAFFVSGAGCGCLGVADGVGSWAEEGVNAAAYARGLMSAAADVCESAGGSESPQDVLTYAQARTEAAGSCTALVAVLRPSAVLDVCVVGDVGLRIIRNDDIAFATDVQEHAFNMPFQLACLDLIPEADTPEAGLQYNTALSAGDIIVAGSDGLFDNMWDDQLTNIVTQSLRCLPASSSSWDSDVAADVARRIAESAVANAVNPEFKSPWAVETQERVPNTLGLMSRLFGPRGGKIDDIAVVVALVV